MPAFPVTSAPGAFCYLVCVFDGCADFILVINFYPVLLFLIEVGDKHA
jgi:hypothetical protein